MRISDWSSDVCSSDLCEIGRLRRLLDEVDRAADRTGAVIDRVRAVIDLDLLEVERIGAAVLGAVAHTVDGDVVAGRIAAQVNAVAIAAAAFASADGDARNGAERVAQREQVLLADRLGGNDGDRLRRVAARVGCLRRLNRTSAGEGTRGATRVA